MTPRYQRALQEPPASAELPHDGQGLKEIPGCGRTDETANTDGADMSGIIIGALVVVPLVLLIANVTGVLGGSGRAERHQ